MANKQHTHFGYKVLAFVIIIIALAQVFTARGFKAPYFDPPPPPPPVDTPDLHFPIQQNEQIDPAAPAQPAINLQDPANIKKTVEYDPVANKYYLNEQVGDQNVKNPTYLTPEEYLKIKGNEDETDYWKQRLDALSMFNQKPTLPDMTKDGVFNRLFGSDKITVKPQGNLDLTFGGNWQNMKNPNLTQRAQKYGIFDFDMQMNVNLLAQIGDKLKLNISNNTQPSFGEQNLQKLEYTGKEDDIIKKIEAGTVSFPLKSTLLTGPLALFGLKTQLQFGKLFVTGVLSQQKSQRKSISLQGGAQTQSFNITADNYEENRDFLLGQYFYTNYDTALTNFPVIQSMVVLNRVDVWITNRTGATTNVRSTINFMDLGERYPYQPSLSNPSTVVKNGLPDNRSNRLYQLLSQNPSLRTPGAGTTNSLISVGLDSSQGKDYTVATMRRLNASEYTFQPQLGYISLNTQVNADDIVGVAYTYTVNGQVYQVGEFPEQISPDSTSTKVLYLKMLKGIAASPKLPIWNLMMKNIYSIGGGNISKTDFKLNVLYQDPGGGQKRYLPDGPQAGVPLIKLLNLDRLDAQNDPFPDGVFDYVEGITINSQAGKIIFPKLEPFGRDLKPAFGGDVTLENRYLYQVLYDSTKTIARQFQQNNRFVIQGNYKGASGSEVSLGGYNIPQGSVTVTAGGQRLAENVDYQVDYSRGTVKILNQGILASNVPINISYEDNASFGLVQQNFWGLRFDYNYSPKLTIGGTVMRLTERPFTTVVNYGDDPIKNTVAGLDANYQSEFPWLTKALDKLPIYSTTAPSLISLRGEVAGILPGHQKFINSLDPEGSVSIDNFEGANSYIDLRTPSTSWTLASTPSTIPNANDNIGLSSNDDRAKLAWYMLEPTLIDPSTAPDNIKADTGMQDYWRLIQQTEVFPEISCVTGQCGLQTFDLGYYPRTRGPYNFNKTPGQFDVNGHFTQQASTTKWGGIQRSLDNNSSDFEAQNVEYISFWVLDPFIYKTTNAGDLYINLGNVSEDVLKDSRMSFENGIPSPKTLDKLDKTQWGYVPRLQQQITNSFDNDPAVRAIQDVGYDELADSEEVVNYAGFLTAIKSIGIGQAAQNKLNADPSSDNFHHFRGNDYDTITAKNGLAFQRYIDFNNPQGNSPVSDLNSQYTTSGSTVPESEDINKDNALNETEAYYQYHVHLAPSTDPSMTVGQNFIVNKRVSSVKLQNGRTQAETWYQFKIPIAQYEKAIGGISDFRSMRFVRLFMQGFTDTTVVRFAQLQLDRNQWRQYIYSLSSPGENIPQADLNTTTFALSAVSIEQSSNRNPIPYVLPPGLQRQLTPSTTGQTLQQDEQSISLQVCGLKDGDSRAVFKEQTLDMRMYKTLRMFIHAETQANQATVRDGDLQAIIRIGSDFINNYYEYRIPLTITSPVAKDASQIWPAANNLNLKMSEFTDLKLKRDAQNYPAYLPYSTVDANGNTLVIVGSPNFGEVKDLMLGVTNPKRTTQNPNDDGLRKCAEVWFDEFRLVDPDETPAYAASGQADIQLADLGSVHMDANMHTAGYGNIDQKIDQRYKDDYHGYGANTNLNIGKLMPKSFGLQLPIFAGYTQTLSNPKYDPFDQDILLSDKINAATSEKAKDSIRRVSQDFTSVTSFNLANIRYLGNPEKKSTGATMPWSLKNFDANYSFNRAYKRNPLIDKDELVEQRLGLGYNYTVKTKFIEPFKKMIKSKSKWYLPIKDFNFNLLPSSFSFRSNLHRIVDETQVRNIDGGPYDIPATFYKNFTWDRTYNLRWELTRSLSFNYNADNQSRIDEPYGKIDSKEKRDSLLKAIATFGRNTYFTQSFSTTYNLPTQKFPFLDWTRASATYSSTYNYTAASLLAYSQGNTITNTQSKQFTGELNFTQLYNKSRYLKAINALPDAGKKVVAAAPKGGLSKGGKGGLLKGGKQDNAAPDTPDPDAGLSPKEIRQKRREEDEKKREQNKLPPRPKKKQVDKDRIPGADTMSVDALDSTYHSLKTINKKNFKKELAAWRIKRQNSIPFIPDGVKVAGRLVTMLKRVNVNYSETGGTVLPGFRDSSQFFGVNSRSSDGWYDFAFGAQPNRAWFDKQAQMQRITQDSFFNGQIQQTYTQNYNIQATLEPFPNFRVDITWNMQFSKNYSETFKYNSDDQTMPIGYYHYNPYSMGSYSVTFIGLKTMFKPSSANQLSPLYLAFLNYGPIVSKRLGSINPYTGSTPDPQNPAYAKGYTQYSQDVLIPAFLAAYSGKDPTKIPLLINDNGDIKSNPFQSFFPLPNWKLNYNGLAKLPAFAEFLNNFTLTHSYVGTMSINNFLSSLYYQDILGVGFPSFIDSTSHNYVPFFTVPNVTITENLGPLLGFEAAFKNGLNLSMKFNKTRMVSLSLVDYQVSESKSSEIVIGGGARIKGLVLPFSVFGVRKLKNDLNFNVSVGYRNDLTSNSYLAQNTNVPTQGQKVISISPTLDYTVNDFLQLRFFYDRRQSVPVLSTSYPITTTRAGVTLRFLFAPQ